MSKKFEVTYTYCVDAIMVVEADSPEAAEAEVERLWTGEDVSKEKPLDFTDFEVLGVRKK
jgi:hypothetical protein